MKRSFTLLAVPALAGALLAAAPATAFDFGFGMDTRGAAAQAETRGAPPVRLAQAGGDPFVRIDQLQEEVRSLNGRIEDLSFQILQIQEQMRKAQEDNEFRFQQLEGGAKPAAPAAGGRRSQAAPPAAPAGSGDAEMAGAAPAAAGSGDPIRDVLENGLDTGAVGTTQGKPAAAAAAPAAGSRTVASIKPSGSGEMYDLAYNYLLAGDYQLAEDTFRQYAQTYPDAKDAADAQYWLGESQYAQGEYTDAAETFLGAQKAHPDSAKAPEMLLKLGMALAKLDNRETACVTFAEVSKRYPNVSASVSRKLKQERAASRCS